MDYFNYVFTICLCLDHSSTLAVYGRVWELSDFIKNALICVPKMNGGIMSLERHEGEYDRTFVSGWTIPLIMLQI